MFLDLNQEQKEAVETVEGPLLVLAGAGSGKTRVVTYRIAHLLSLGIHPSKILGLTFTNKAAGEMRERIHKLTHQQILISTFHSLGARILRESIHALGYLPNFTIYDEEDVHKLLRSCIDELKLKLPSTSKEKVIDPKVFKSLISNAKNRLQTPEEITLPLESQDPIEIAFPQVYSRYQAYLKQYNAVDFDDLLFLTVKLFKEQPEILKRYHDRWTFFLVDEYQDTNQAQYEMVRTLVAPTGNLCVVGDPDQSIYSWRGANIHNILNFEKDFIGAKVVRLEQNYRSRSTLLKAANAVIAYNTGRYEKKLWSDRGPGDKIKHFTANTELEEARFVAESVDVLHREKRIPLKDIAIFYRTNAQSRPLEDRFLSKKVPYTIVGGISFYQRREIKDILAFLRMVESETDFISFSRTLNLPKRGLGEATIERIRNGAILSGKTLLAYCEAVVRGEVDWKPTPKQRQGLSDYLSTTSKLKRIGKECSLKELIVAAIEETGYLTHLREDPATFEDRKENLDELIAKAMEWELAIPEATLSGFLEELSLKSTLDEVEGEEDRVNLMTIHHGKGLEFTVVFLVGLEEDLFPHANARGSPEALEEERRLFYVGMTRAKEFLFLTDSRFRYLWGMGRTQRASRFLKEIPREFVEKVHGAFYFRRDVLAEKPSIAHEKREIKEEKKQEEKGLSQGDMVCHPEFGIGKIQETYQGSLGLTYRIFFSKDFKVREIVDRYARLVRL